MTTFCLEHRISRKTFYVIRARARDEGQAAALQPRSRRPVSSPTRIVDDVKQQALDVRAALERSGLDFGPISVFEKMRAMGLTPPSEASLARIFRDKGVARVEPKKRPRAAWRRFVYPAPNCLWQLDATEYVLTGGRKCVIFQLEDDNTRVMIASHVASGETAAGALTVMRKGVDARGVPQRLLTDNGSALNPHRRGVISQLVAYVTSLGVEPITGRQARPTTQGKNERVHQTLFRWLDKQPLADTVAQLQAQVDAFDVIYNTERPHQSLPGRITPQQAWDATPAAEPPRPSPRVQLPTMAAPGPPPPPPRPGPPAAPARWATDGEDVRIVRADGAVKVHGIRFLLDRQQTGSEVHVTWTPTGVCIFDHRGTLLAEHDWPPAGVSYVGNGRPRGRPRKLDKRHRPSPMS